MEFRSKKTCVTTIFETEVAPETAEDDPEPVNADRSNVLEVGELSLGCVNDGENVWLRELPPPPPPLPPPP